MFVQLYDWLTLRDLDKALEKARVSVVKRFARGNVTFQNGYILDECGLIAMRREGDFAVEKLKSQQRAHSNDEPKRVRR